MTVHNAIVVLSTIMEFRFPATPTVTVIAGGDARKRAGQVQTTRVVAGEIKHTGCQ